ncbi:MAG: hypothetical protein K0R76_1338 [Alphaproteobacteria bacterium]|jgi:rare lipoprotein A (peptidoglycan hydrolase)|nr:hypothetical protein [Alphaproteobacteria bacterium]
MQKIVGAIILAAFVLAGCSTTVHEKAQGNLCTGTKKPYQVKGTWYTPQEHYEYKEIGTASWYGPKFHGRPKSCGEIFDMHGMSAAHKLLPIPSVVRVTNVQNGSTVKLLIDDRGPFVDDRIIDLSKGAATYLGLCNRGLGKVCVECLPEESKAFAKFVAKYGRYGRDPSGRSWEAIFREKFDNEDRISAPGLFQTIRPRRVQKNENWPGPRSVKSRQPFRRPAVKPMPVSDRSFTLPEEDVSEKEIDQLLNETRAYLGRKRA